MHHHVNVLINTIVGGIPLKILQGNVLVALNVRSQHRVHIGNVTSHENLPPRRPLVGNGHDMGCNTQKVRD